jgi:hypothetical protein
LGELLGRSAYKAVEKTEGTDLNPDDFQVHPTLRAKALEILQKNSKNS